MLATDIFQIIFLSIVVIVGVGGFIMALRSKDDEE
jgi:hypothetical protein